MTSLSQWRQEVSKKKEDERFRGDATLCGSAVSCADAAAVSCQVGSRERLGPRSCEATVGIAVEGAQIVRRLSAFRDVAAPSPVPNTDRSGA